MIVTSHQSTYTNVFLVKRDFINDYSPLEKELFTKDDNKIITSNKFTATNLEQNSKESTFCLLNKVSFNSKRNTKSLYTFTSQN